MANVMDRIQIALGDYPPQDEPFTAMTATDRQAIIELLNDAPNGYFEITMPCGYSQKFEKPEDIPLSDLPCSCGQVNRYLIKYQKE